VRALSGPRSAGPARPSRAVSRRGVRRTRRSATPTGTARSISTRVAGRAPRPRRGPSLALAHGSCPRQLDGRLANGAVPGSRAASASSARSAGRGLGLTGVPWAAARQGTAMPASPRSDPERPRELAYCLFTRLEADGRRRAPPPREDPAASPGSSALAPESMPPSPARSQGRERVQLRLAVVAAVAVVAPVASARAPRSCCLVSIPTPGRLRSRVELPCRERRGDRGHASARASARAASAATNDESTLRRRRRPRCRGRDPDSADDRHAAIQVGGR
jgi:hypothetical protein